MTLKEQLTDAMKMAMKARDSLRLSAVRMVLSALKNREIEQQKELDDNAVVEVISTLVKQRRESVRLYEAGGRLDLAAKEEAELNILLGFLPVQMDLVEINELVTGIILEISAEGVKDMGRVMKAVTKLTAGRAEGRVVSDIVRSRLS